MLTVARPGAAALRCRTLVLPLCYREVEHLCCIGSGGTTFFFLFTYIDFVVLVFYFNLHYITGILKVHVILNGSEFVKRNYPQTRAVTVNIRWGWKIQETKTSAHTGLVWRPSP